MYRLHGALAQPRREGPVGVIALVPPRRSASVCPSSGRGFSARYGFWRGLHSYGAGWGALRDLVARRWGLAWGRLRVLSRSMKTSGKSRGVDVGRIVSWMLLPLLSSPCSSQFYYYCTLYGQEIAQKSCSDLHT